MRAHPDWRVLNRGINGERSDQIRARFSRDVDDERRRSTLSDPFVVVIVAGVNDIYQGRPAAAKERLSERRRGPRSARALRCSPMAERSPCRPNHA